MLATSSTKKRDRWNGGDSGQTSSVDRSALDRLSRVNSTPDYCILRRRIDRETGAFPSAFCP